MSLGSLGSSQILLRTGSDHHLHFFCIFEKDYNDNIKSFSKSKWTGLKCTKTETNMIHSLRLKKGNILTIFVISLCRDLRADLHIGNNFFVINVTNFTTPFPQFHHFYNTHFSLIFDPPPTLSEIFSLFWPPPLKMMT